MSKTLCELKRDLKHDFDSYALLVCQPRFVCKDCGRAANKKKYLCNPRKIEGLVSAEPHMELDDAPEEALIPVFELLATR